MVKSYLTRKRKTRSAKLRKQRGGAFTRNLFPDFWKPCIEEAKRLFLEAERLDQEAVSKSHGVHWKEEFFINGSIASLFHIDHFLSVELLELEKRMTAIEIDEIVETMKDFISLYPKPHDLDLFIWTNFSEYDVFNNNPPGLYDYIPIFSLHSDFKGWKHKSAMVESADVPPPVMPLVNAGGAPGLPPPLYIPPRKPGKYTEVVLEPIKDRYIFESIDYGFIRSNVPMPEPVKVKINGCTIIGLQHLYNSYRFNGREKNKKRITLMEYLVSTIQRLNTKYPD
ncbi:MAG: hypothetical protein EB127_27755, partial [Alphaproteobacteria bacterium]|nr:hypothetical protein [Alphaproteobacteria bacterium]